MKKIAIIKTFPTNTDRNYYNSQEVGLAQSIAAFGYELHIYTPCNTNKVIYREHEECDRVKFIDLPYKKIPIIEQAVFYGLFNELRRHKYSLIHCNEQNEFTTFLTSIYASNKNIPFIIYQGIYKADSSRLKRFYQLLYDITLSKILKKNLSIALTKTFRAKKYLSSKGFKNVEVLPVGLDITNFKNSEPHNWEKRLNIPRDSKILLYVGSLEKRRNIQFLLKLSANLINDNYYLLIAGDGPEKGLLTQKDLTSNVKYLGKVRQQSLKSLYEYSDLFLLASDYEIYGMVVLEALYCGCPVISTKTAGPEDMINETNGKIIDNLNISEWSDTIIKSYNKFDRSLISRNLTAELTWPVITKKYLQLTHLENNK